MTMLAEPIPVHVAACRVEIPPPIQVESQPAMTVMTQEMVSELKKHPLETPITVQVESQPFLSKSMISKTSVLLEEEASKADVILPVETAIAKESVEGKEVVRKVNEAVEMATMSTEDSESEEDELKSQDTSVQAKANGFDEAMQKTTPEASKPHLPHKTKSWVRFVTFCCGGPAVHALDNTFKQAQLSCCCCAEKEKRSARPGNTLAHTVTSFCCGGPQKLFAL